METLETDLYIIPSFWQLQEINLTQAIQYEATDDHDHFIAKFKFKCDST